VCRSVGAPPRFSFFRRLVVNATRTNASKPFEVKDCALITIATGRRAQSLKELREHLVRVRPSSLYSHFWGGLLQARFEEREYNNDFASWVRHALHDKTLAERLAIVDPTRFSDLEALREEVIEIIDERLDERDLPSWASPDQQFEFIRSQVVVFRTPEVLERPEELPGVFERLSLGSVFYHFIDARRRREDGEDDFRGWLSQFGDEHAELRRRIGEVDPYFAPLAELKGRLSAIYRDYFNEAAHG
jgi:hypothetical protein